MSKIFYNVSLLFLTMSSFGWYVFGLSFYYSHVIILSGINNKFIRFVVDNNNNSAKNISLLFVISFVLLLNVINTGFMPSFALFLKMSVFYLIYLIFLYGIVNYKINFLYVGIYTTALYMAYQLVSWNVFGGALSYSQANQFPGIFDDYGTQVSSMSGLFGLGDSYITHSMSNIMFFTNYLGYKVSGFGQEFSYVSAMTLPFLFLPLSKLLKLTIVFILLFSLSKNTIGTLVFISIYYMISMFFNKKIVSYAMVVGFVVIIIALSGHFISEVPGTSVAARFYTIYYYLTEFDIISKITGIGFGTNLEVAGYISNGKIMNSIGSALIYHGIIGLLMYVCFFIIVLSRTKYYAFILSIFFMQFNWAYMTSWPVLSMMFALNTYYSQYRYIRAFYKTPKSWLINS